MANAKVPAQLLANQSTSGVDAVFLGLLNQAMP